MEIKLAYYIRKLLTFSLFNQKALYLKYSLASFFNLFSILIRPDIKRLKKGKN